MLCVNYFLRAYMAKVTAQNITDLNFVPEMYGKTTANFSAYIDAVIAEQSKILEGRVGVSNYALTTSPAKEYIARAELCLAAAEMIQRRMNRILGNVVGTGNALDITMERKQRQDYLDEAEKIIQKIVDGVTADSSDFASGVLETSHFEESSTLGGLEI